MRTRSSIINISVGLGNQLIITFLSFFSRTVFIQTLGIDYLGVNGLFTNILAMLSLAEAGIGSSIIYNLYKPVAENDKEKMLMLMKLYKKAYLVIALIVFVLGLSIMPFLNYFVKDTNVAHIHLIYFVFLMNTVTPYFFQYKSSFLNVSQKGYIVTGMFSISSIVSTSLKIVILYMTQNYVVYLIIDSMITLINSFILSLIVDRLYPFLKEKITKQIDQLTKSNLVKNIKAIILQNVGTYFIFGTDNIIISYYVSVAAVGLYSNYFMLIDICRTFINQIFNNIYHSIGNLVAKESKEKIYRVYRVTMFLNFWLYSLFAIVLFIMIEPFISLWIGPKFLMDKLVLIVLVVTFYERGMRNSISTVKTTAGIFHEDRFVPLCQAGVNLVFSIILVQYIGIAGVFIGTLISAMVVPFWTTPYFVYKKVFHKSIFRYFSRYFYYGAVGVGTCLITSYIANLVVAESIFSLGLKALLCLCIPNLIYILLFHRSDEYKYLLGIAKGMLSRVQRKVTPKGSSESF
ncbi:lipopolysaccharide biosynthesis protein [Paenibacillus oryzisoli]|uniref:Flippase n=1 Tax=Paenibacillus oryzisoli TaxID=1850517 RepID=A0A198A7T6_9BACL|nr:flippase [Paenibacillus oryzisoli]OAS17207.1 flippase [Paenibacillus oryzisoli]